MRETSRINVDCTAGEGRACAISLVLSFYGFARGTRSRSSDGGRLGVDLRSCESSDTLGALGLQRRRRHGEGVLPEIGLPARRALGGLRQGDYSHGSCGVIERPNRSASYYILTSVL